MQVSCHHSKVITEDADQSIINDRQKDQRIPALVLVQSGVQKG